MFSVQSPAEAEQLKAKYSKEIARYSSETKDLQNQANATQDEVAALERRSDWFDFSEVLLEAGLVVSSITLLTANEPTGIWVWHQPE